MSDPTPMEVDTKENSTEVVSENPVPTTPISPISGDLSEIEFAKATVGIDLGDLYCRVSLMNPESQIPDIIRNNLSNEKTPSVVSFRISKERQFGDEAVSILTSQPKSAVGNLKSIVGIQFNENLSADSQLLFEINYEKNTIEVNLEPESKTSLTSTQVLAMLFKQLLFFCRQFKRVNNPNAFPAAVIVSVPSFFSETQRGAVRDALQVSGVPSNIAHVLPEGQAQLICFHHTHYSEIHINNPKAIVLVDVGHSHTSVVLGKITKLTIENVASAAAPIGSHSVDISITKECFDHIKSKYGFDITGKPKQTARILRESQKCKEMLSMLDNAQVTVESLTDEVDLMFPVKKETLLSFASKLGDVLVDLCQKVLDSSEGMTIDQIERVEILGGGTLMPYLQERLKEFWQKPLSTTMDGSLSTSRGCALYGVLKEPTADTTSILESIISKADEVRRLMETLHHVRLIPAVDTTPSFATEEQLQSFIAVEEELSRRDRRYIDKATSKNAVEEYIYGMRNHLINPDMKKALGSDVQAVSDILRGAENWLMEEGEDVDAELYQEKLSSVKTELQEKYPTIQKELERQQEEQAKKDAIMAAEALKAQAENKKEPRTDAERIKFAEERKEQGNALFKQEHYSECITRYVQALGYLGEVYSSDEETKKKKDEISFSCYLNVAAAAIKTGLHQRAVENCNKALEINKNSAKAYFRKGQALVAKQEWEEAKKELTKALELAPGDKAIEKELTTLQKKVEQHKQKEKKMFANMFK